MALTGLAEKGDDIDVLRHGSSLPELLEPRRTADKALTAVMRQACIQGASTGSVGEKALGMSCVSKSQVSRSARCDMASHV